MRASFLPGARNTVKEKLDQLSMHRIDLTAGTVLERDCVYIVPLLEMTALPRRTAAAANPKSSTGRLDVFARVITDYGAEFDRVREGYKGPLYAEISPRAFSIVVRTGSRLVQLRIRRGSPIFRDTALRRLHAESPLVELPEDGAPASQAIRNGLVFTIDVIGQPDSGLVGYKARRHTDVIDVDKIDFYDPSNDFWEPVYAQREAPETPAGLVLDPKRFLHPRVTRGGRRAVPDHAAEMLPYDTFVGEFRALCRVLRPRFRRRREGGRPAAAAPSLKSVRTRCRFSSSTARRWAGSYTSR